MNGRIKRLLGNLPLSVEAYWALHGSRKTWSAHYQMEGLKKVLPEAVGEVKVLAQTNPEAKKVCVFATLHYWIEQAGLVALALAGQGHHVELGYLPYAEWDTEINQFDLRRQDMYTRDVFAEAEEVMRIVPLLKQSRANPDLKGYPLEMAEIIRQVSDYDTQYTLQAEETDPTSALYQLRQQRNTQAALLIYDWLKQSQPDVLVVPNGTILEMGIAFQIAKLLNIHTVTFEFADQRERIWIAQDSEIMNHDTNALWDALGNQPLPEKARQTMLELFSARKNAKLWGNFALQWQQSGVQGASKAKEALGLDDRPVVLLATNVLGDSLTLGRQRISDTMAEMIVGTIRYFTAHAEAQLVIRIHPGELRTHGTSMVEVINKNFADLPEHIHLVYPEDKTNTYDLMGVADLGLVYTTTAGLEMAMAGLPVITTGKTHYAKRGFTFEPGSWQEYEALLDKMLADPKSYRLSAEQVEKAWLYAYLFFFEFSLPFPWHVVWLKQDFKERSMHFVLSSEGQQRYGKTFGYLVNNPLDWSERGLARLEELSPSLEAEID